MGVWFTKPYVRSPMIHVGQCAHAACRSAGLPPPALDPRQLARFKNELLWPPRISQGGHPAHRRDSPASAAKAGVHF